MSAARPAELARRLGRLRFPLAAPTWPGTVERPAPERRVGLDYDHEWSRRYLVRLARAVVLDNLTRPAARLLTPTTVRGLEHLRHLDGPVIFAANHASHLDTPLLLTTLPARYRHKTVVAAAADYFFDRTWKAVLWSFSLAAIPIDRSRVNRRSVDAAAALIEDGWSLIVFPEGGRSPDGWSQAFRPASAAYLARRTGRPVVPVHLHGTRHVLARRHEHDGPAPGGSGTEGRLAGRLRRSPTTVLFGFPVTPGDGEDARRLNARVEAAVATLADEVATDWWTARRRAADGRTPPPTGPDAGAWRRSWALGPVPGDEHPGTGEPAWPKI
ncbi:MAG: lysophospholipid acyltransferase family protein [Acidimicrobiales bacterium]